MGSIPSLESDVQAGRAVGTRKLCWMLGLIWGALEPLPGPREGTWRRLWVLENRPVCTLTCCWVFAWRRTLSALAPDEVINPLYSTVERCCGFSQALRKASGGKWLDTPARCQVHQLWGCSRRSWNCKVHSVPLHFAAAQQIPHACHSRPRPALAPTAPGNGSTRTQAQP